MIECPHCNYKHGGFLNDSGDWEDIETKEGEFWTHPLTMKRNEGSDWYSNGDKETPLYACPSCGKTFIEVD